jgi:hypothetical protein
MYPSGVWRNEINVRSRDDGARLNVQIERLQHLTASRSYKGCLPEYAVRVCFLSEKRVMAMDG